MCLEVRNAGIKQRIEKLAFLVYDKIGEGPEKSTRNVTAIEKAFYAYETQTLLPVHSSGYRRRGMPINLGDIYTVSFTETVLDALGVPEMRCHVLTIFFSAPDLATPMDHVEVPCAENDKHVEHVYEEHDFRKVDDYGVVREAQEERSVNIMSYNVWNFEKNYDKRLSMIVEQILQENTDVVSMQEVRWSNYEYPNSQSRRGDSVLDLASRLYKHGYKHWAWRPAMIYPQGLSKRTMEGLAVFSKLPITEIDAYPLDRLTGNSEDYHQRLLLRVQLETRTGIQFNVFTSHFSLFESARDSGCVQIRNIMHRFSNTGPTFLTGDLNAELHQSKGLQYLLGNGRLSASTGFLSDAYDWNLQNIDVEKDLKSLKKLREASWTYTTLQKAPKKKIDFIFYDEKQCSVEGYYTVVNQFKDQKIQPSDHRAIVAKFKIAPK